MTVAEPVEWHGLLGPANLHPPEPAISHPRQNWLGLDLWLIELSLLDNLRIIVVNLRLSIHCINTS